jgi:hypothetical protein
MITSKGRAPRRRYRCQQKESEAEQPLSLADLDNAVQQLERANILLRKKTLYATQTLDVQARIADMRRVPF